MEHKKFYLRRFFQARADGKHLVPGNNTTNPNPRLNGAKHAGWQTSWCRTHLLQPDQTAPTQESVGAAKSAPTKVSSCKITARLCTAQNLLHSLPITTGNIYCSAAMEEMGRMSRDTKREAAATTVHAFLYHVSNKLHSKQCRLFVSQATTFIIKVMTDNSVTEEKDLIPNHQCSCTTWK